LVPNPHLRLLEFEFFRAATLRATITTGGLTQLMVSSVMCASTPGRCYKETLKKSLKQLRINSATWEDLAQDRTARRRSAKTGSTIYEANRMAAAKAKIAALRSQEPRTNTANAHALPACPRCQRIFRARIGLVGHLRMQCTNNPTIPISTSNSANSPSDSPTLTPGINSITPTIIEITSIYSSPVTPTTAFAFNTTTTTISDGESLLSCTQCDRTFTSCIGLVGHLRTNRTETG
uniref:C2H2-type domain-containing protein n=1 Tax=Schistocephalus solidus TaxID=70667 RepID=A0A183TRE8_SCHSO